MKNSYYLIKFFLGLYLVLSCSHAIAQDEAKPWQYHFTFGLDLQHIVPISNVEFLSENVIIDENVYQISKAKRVLSRSTGFYLSVLKIYDYEFYLEYSIDNIRHKIDPFLSPNNIDNKYSDISLDIQSFWMSLMTSVRVPLLGTDQFKLSFLPSAGFTWEFDSNLYVISRVVSVRSTSISFRGITGLPFIVGFKLQGEWWVSERLIFDVKLSGTQSGSELPLVGGFRLVNSEPTNLGTYINKNNAFKMSIGLRYRFVK